MSIDRPDPAISEAEAEARMAARRDDALATMAKADHRMLAGDYRAAAAFYGAVGRLAGQGAAIPRGELLRARDAAVWLDNRFGEMLREGLEGAGLGEGQRHPRFQLALDIMAGRRARAAEHDPFPQRPQTYYHPGLPLVHFADTATFAWREAVEAATPAILAEAQALLAEDGSFRPYMQQTRDRPQGDVHGLLDNPDWSTYYLTDKGQPIADRVARCPTSYTVLDEGVPLCRIGTRAPSIMFSLLRPHSRIPAHTGMVNCRFICHLPLIVPPGCGFRVAAETREWEVGRLLAFDDSVEHEAWNDSDQDRLVLIFDVWRPDVSLDERHQIETLFRIVDSY
ncbi:MAG TPA: aspartyl/asparaginyl beta-hydroxylase domain-containing protein [Novosphingobium sp.]|nr:aspartyl/asparaginyl beta-hydroxylase domain-containing protein [Novosphingobium sp.]